MKHPASTQLPRAERRGECRGSRSAFADLDGTNASGLWPLAAPKPPRASRETRLALAAGRPTYSADEGLS